MLPINEALIHFFNNYGGDGHNTTIVTIEFQTTNLSSKIYNNLTCLMDINSLVAYIEGICTDINGEANTYLIELVDKNTDQTITLQSSNALQSYAYRIEVTIH